MTKRTSKKRNERSPGDESPTRSRGGDGAPQRTQAQRRQESRTALIDATLDLVADGEAFEALSLRKIAATAGLAPSAFYRYFDSKEALGTAIVEESFHRLQRRLADGDTPPPGDVGARLSDLVDLIAEHTRQEYRHLAFIARERIAGDRALRRAVRTELRIMVNRMATLLARNPPVSTWPTKDIMMLASLMVTVLTVSVDGLLDVLSNPTRRDDSTALDDLRAYTKMQLAYLLSAQTAWQPETRSGNQ